MKSDFEKLQVYKTRLFRRWNKTMGSRDNRIKSHGEAILCASLWARVCWQGDPLEKEWREQLIDKLAILTVDWSSQSER